MTGRISTVPMRALGRRPAMRMTSLRSRASISQNPPSCSFVSAKGRRWPRGGRQGSDGGLTGMAAAVAEALPNSVHRSLVGGWHGVPDDSLAPVLTEFFCR
jgi:hypothetical protein